MLDGEATSSSVRRLAARPIRLMGRGEVVRWGRECDRDRRSFIGGKGKTWKRAPLSSTNCLDVIGGTDVECNDSLPSVFPAACPARVESS
jgi:hypothetical protein